MVQPINKNAPIRSQDNLYAYGVITAESKLKMAEACGQPIHVIMETENRMTTYLQCPEMVRKGKTTLFTRKIAKNSILNITRL